MTPVEVLVAHQRRDIESCLCGWAVLGASHAQHQVDALEAAGWVLRPLVAGSVDVVDYGGGLHLQVPSYTNERWPG